MITIGEAIAYLLPGLCPSCEALLPAPGQPCQACGQIPEVTAAEAAEALGSPVALAVVESRKLEAEAMALHEQSVAKFRDAGNVVHLARLRVRQDGAQKALDGHNREHKKLYGPQTAARRAEAKAAGDLAEASAQHEKIARDEELARRMKHGVTAETEAAMRLDKATGVLRRYRDELDEAQRKRAQAEHDVQVSAARGEMLEKARDDAVAAVLNPGRPPMGRQAILASPFLLAITGRLTGEEQLMAGLAGRALCALTGITDSIVSDARADLLAEQEAEARGKPLHLRNGPGGVHAQANPLAPGTPQPFHPAAPVPAGAVVTPPPAVPASGGFTA